MPHARTHTHSNAGALLATGCPCQAPAHTRVRAAPQRTASQPPRPSCSALALHHPRSSSAGLPCPPRQPRTLSPASKRLHACRYRQDRGTAAFGVTATRSLPILAARPPARLNVKILGARGCALPLPPTAHTPPADPVHRCLSQASPPQGCPPARHPAHAPVKGHSCACLHVCTRAGGTGRQLPGSQTGLVGGVGWHWCWHVLRCQVWLSTAAAPALSSGQGGQTAQCRGPVKRIKCVCARAGAQGSAMGRLARIY